jgi:hypothetical protein
MTFLNKKFRCGKQRGVTTFGWTQKLSPHALSLRDEKQEKELQFRV